MEPYLFISKNILLAQELGHKLPWGTTGRWVPVSARAMNSSESVVSSVTQGKTTSMTEGAGGFLDPGNAPVEKMLNTFLEGAFYSWWNGFTFTRVCQLLHREGGIKQIGKIISDPFGNV